MHLSPPRIEAIKNEAEPFFDAQAGVCASGSLAGDRQHGFTLVELIMVMVITGILAAFVAPRFFDADVFQSRGAADQVRAAFRYGQKVAIAQHRNVIVNISAGTTSNCGAELAGGDINCVISNNVAVVPALPRAVAFNALGQPVPNAAVAITVGTTAINIEAETGYVH